MVKVAYCIIDPFVIDIFYTPRYYLTELPSDKLLVNSTIEIKGYCSIENTIATCRIISVRRDKLHDRYLLEVYPMSVPIRYALS